MGGTIGMEQKGLWIDGCWTNYMTLVFEPTMTLTLDNQGQILK